MLKMKNGDCKERSVKYPLIVLMFVIWIKCGLCKFYDFMQED